MLLKPEKIRSKKIRDSAEGEPCLLRVAPKCSGRDTVVFCHAPSPYKGTATKSDDTWGAYGCYNCHEYTEANRNDPEVLRAWLRAIPVTQKRLYQKGLIQIT